MASNYITAPSTSGSKYTTYHIPVVGGEAAGTTTITNGRVVAQKVLNSQEVTYGVSPVHGTHKYASVDTTAGAPDGVYYWPKVSRVIYASNGTLYIRDISGGLSTSLAAVLTAGETIGFTEYLFTSGQHVLIITDGTWLIQLETDFTYTRVAISTTGIGANPVVPTPVAVDGYLFLAVLGTGDIYNSNLNAPLTFTSGDFLSGEMLPDRIERLAVFNNHVVAVSNSSIEFFYDAAVASGSPLQRNLTAAIQLEYMGGFCSAGQVAYLTAVVGGVRGVHRISVSGSEPVLVTDVFYGGTDSAASLLILENDVVYVKDSTAVSLVTRTASPWTAIPYLSASANNVFKTPTGTFYFPSVASANNGFISLSTESNVTIYDPVTGASTAPTLTVITPSYSFGSTAMKFMRKLGVDWGHSYSLGTATTLSLYVNGHAVGDASVGASGQFRLLGTLTRTMREGWPLPVVYNCLRFSQVSFKLELVPTVQRTIIYNIVATVQQGGPKW